MGDLLYCVDSDRLWKSDKAPLHTRHAMQESKVKKYRKILQAEKEKVIGDTREVDWKSGMSAYNKKTLNFEAFKNISSARMP